LSRKKPKRRFEKPAEQLKTAAPFLERRSLRLALGLIAIAVIRIAAAWPEMSITFDEPAAPRLRLAVCGPACLFV